MTDRIREDAIFRHGKTPIIEKYSEDHKKLMGVIAGRGFSSLPGYAYEMENNLEIVAKRGLSELNFKILTETIERELKQAGIDYDLAYKAAAITWEIDKQTLLANWDKELAGIKQGMESEEEVLNQVAIEVGKRGIFLLQQKTAIELDAEAYRKTLAELDGSTASYEVSLANARLLTAQKKLEVIPILQGIIVKEQALLLQEQAKAAAYTDYMAAEQEVITKKETLIPVIGDLVAASERYTSELENQIEIEGQISDEKVTQAGIMIEKAAAQTAAAEKDLLIAEANLDLQDQKRLLSDAKNTTEVALLDGQRAEANTLQSAESTANDTILANERSTQTYVLDKKRTTINAENRIKKESSSTLTSAEIGKMRYVTELNAATDKSKAQIEATAKITASLTHLIG